MVSLVRWLRRATRPARRLSPRPPAVCPKLEVLEARTLLDAAVGAPVAEQLATPEAKAIRTESPAAECAHIGAEIASGRYVGKLQLGEEVKFGSGIVSVKSYRRLSVGFEGSEVAMRLEGALAANCITHVEGEGVISGVSAKVVGEIQVVHNVGRKTSLAGKFTFRFKSDQGANTTASFTAVPPELPPLPGTGGPPSGGGTIVGVSNGSAGIVVSNLVPGDTILAPTETSSPSLSGSVPDAGTWDEMYMAQPSGPDTGEVAFDAGAFAASATDPFQSQDSL